MGVQYTQQNTVLCYLPTPAAPLPSPWDDILCLSRTALASAGSREHPLSPMKVIMRRRKMGRHYPRIPAFTAWTYLLIIY